MKIKLQWLVVLGLVLLMGETIAQSPEPEEKGWITAEKGDLFVDVAYLGNQVTHPGLIGGVEKLIWVKTKTRTTKRGYLKNKSRQWVAGAHAGGYWHTQNHTALFLTATTGLRKVMNSGFSYEIQAGTGYMRTFRAGETYRVNGSGEVERVRFAGNDYLIPALVLGVGEERVRIMGRNGAMRLRVSSYFQTPYNQLFNPQINCELGFSFPLTLSPKSDS